MSLISIGVTELGRDISPGRHHNFTSTRFVVAGLLEDQIDVVEQAAVDAFVSSRGVEETAAGCQSLGKSLIHQS